MVSVLLVTEACYAINENNNKENQLAKASYHISDIN